VTESFLGDSSGSVIEVSIFLDLYYAAWQRPLAAIGYGIAFGQQQGEPTALGREHGQFDAAERHRMLSGGGFAHGGE
jgi:hypothetical protein